MWLPVISAILLPTLILFPALASAFFIDVPRTLTAGSTVTVKWTRHKGDPAKFSMMLRKLPGENGRLVVVDSRGRETGQDDLPEPVAAEGKYLVEFYPESKLTQGGNLLASSQQIVVSAPPPPPPPPPSTPTTKITSSTSPATKTTSKEQENTTNTPSGGETVTTSPASESKSTGKSNPATSLGGSLNDVTISGGSDSDPSAFATDTATGPLPAPTSDSGTEQDDPSSTPEQTSATSASKSKTPIIVGAVVGGIVGSALLLLLLVMLKRRNRRKNTTEFYRDKMVRVRQSMRFSFMNQPESQYVDAPLTSPAMSERYDWRYAAA